MAGSTQRWQDSELSVWPADVADLPPEPSPWLRRWPALQRLTRSLTPGAGHPTTVPSNRSARRPDAPSLPETSRGQALRLAHRALRERLRVQRRLRQVLPHLYYVERALAHQGSAALLDVPIWVLQRALQQLSRLPADSLSEREQFSVLQRRLVESIGTRSQQAAEPWRPSELPDSFLGSLDSQFGPRSGFQTAPGALDMPHMRDAPPSAFDDLVHEDGTWRDGMDEHAGRPRWRRSG